jgi:uncharacterized protein
VEKWVLFYESADDLDSRVPEHYPAHRKRVDAFHESGKLLAAGSFGDPQAEGAMCIFATLEDAEEFAREDPFVLGGVVRAWRVQRWDEIDW